MPTIRRRVSAVITTTEPRIVRRRIPSVPTIPPPPPPVIQTPPVADYGSFATTQRDVEMEVTDTIENRMTWAAYGEVRYAPKIAYFKCTGTALEIVCVLGEGPIDSVQKVWLYQTEVYPTTVPWCSVSIVTGTLDQSELTIPSDSNWASAFPGYALVALNISLLSEDYEGAGMPDIQVHVKGRKVFDPRLGYSAYSQNPVLIARDILTSPDYGVGIPCSEIDDTSLGTAADACDTLVSGVKKYAVGFVVTDRIEAARLLDELAVACMGRWGWWDGRYRFGVDVGSGSSAATINDDGSGGGYAILSKGDGTSSLRCMARREDSTNACSVTYTDPSDWTTTVPQRQREVRYETANVSKGIEQPRELRITTIPVAHADQAYRLAKQYVLLSQRRRYGVTLAQHGMLLVPGDLATLNSAVGPVSSQVCRVNGVLDNQDGTVELELVEYSASDYSTDTYTTDTATPPASVNEGNWIKYADDFRSGGTASGDVGELGWTVSGSGSYTTESGHPGIFGMSTYGAYLLQLNSSASKFAQNAKWSYRWVVKSGNGNSAGQYFRFGDTGSSTNVFYVDFYVGAGGPTYDIKVNGTDTGYDYSRLSWYQLDVYCNGDGVAYLTLSNFGGSAIYSTSKVVSTTTATNWLFAEAAGFTGAEGSIDYAVLCVAGRE